MDKTPDAIMAPNSWKNGDTSVERAICLSEVCEPILGVNYEEGERAYMHPQPFGMWFVHKGTDETILFPKGHGLEGSPRYNWVKKADGAAYGYLVKAAQKNPVVAAPEVTNA